MAVMAVVSVSGMHDSIETRQRLHSHFDPVIEIITSPNQYDTCRDDLLRAVEQARRDDSSAVARSDENKPRLFATQAADLVREMARISNGAKPHWSRIDEEVVEKQLALLTPDEASNVFLSMMSLNSALLLDKFRHYVGRLVYHGACPAAVLWKVFGLDLSIYRPPSGEREIVFQPEARMYRELDARMTMWSNTLHRILPGQWLAEFVGTVRRLQEEKTQPQRHGMRWETVKNDRAEFLRRWDEELREIARAIVADVGVRRDPTMTLEEVVEWTDPSSTTSVPDHVVEHVTDPSLRGFVSDALYRTCMSRHRPGRKLFDGVMSGNPEMVREAVSVDGARPTDTYNACELPAVMALHNVVPRMEEWRVGEMPRYGEAVAEFLKPLSSAPSHREALVGMTEVSRGRVMEVWRSLVVWQAVHRLWVLVFHRVASTPQAREEGLKMMWEFARLGAVADLMKQMDRHDDFPTMAWFLEPMVEGVMAVAVPKGTDPVPSVLVERMEEFKNVVELLLHHRISSLKKSSVQVVLGVIAEPLQRLPNPRVLREDDPAIHAVQWLFPAFIDLLRQVRRSDRQSLTVAEREVAEVLPDALAPMVREFLPHRTTATTVEEGFHQADEQSILATVDGWLREDGIQRVDQMSMSRLADLVLFLLPPPF